MSSSHGPAGPGRGRFRIEHVAPGGRRTVLAAGSNSWCHEWGAIARAAVLPEGGGPPAAINAAYLEFANVADPSDPVTPPVFDPALGSAYFAALASAAGRDYLRVPLALRPTPYVAAGYEGALPAGAANAAHVVVPTAGTAGVHGRPFGSASGSKLYGIALAWAPDFDDPARDLVWSRGYYDAGRQEVVPPGGQLVAFYDLEFVPE